jgi:thiol-disulfide isomerase/thioredoxin
MPKKFTILFSLLVLSCLSQNLYAQKHSLHLYFPDHKNDTVVLAHYYNGKLFVNDTLIFDHDGNADLDDELRPQGIYTLYFDEKKQLDFLLGADQTLSVRQQNEALEIRGATESEWFQAYVDHLTEKKTATTKLRQQLNESNGQPDLAAELKQKLADLDLEIQEKWKLEAEKGAGTFYGKFMASNIRPTMNKEKLPGAVQSNDSLLWVFNYNFNKNHYWDHFDLLDARMWRTPTINTKLNEYFNQVLIQHPDSVLPVAIELIEASKINREIFQNLTSFVLNNSVQSEYLGIENVFVAVAERYYLSGEAFWITEKTLETIRREVYFRKNNLIGATASELFLPDEEGNHQSLHQQSTPFTLVVFWEPDCGHCKKQIPQLFEEIFLQIDPSKLAVMAVYTQTDKEEWLHFLEEHELNGWLNVWDPDQVSNFQVNYNIRTTPIIYLLDEEKKIVAKKLTVDQVKQLLSQLIEAN